MENSKTRVVAIIPARMASTRFPGKPLATILGLPMIEHVRRRVELCGRIEEVIVATCDEAIAKAVRSFGGRAVMTSDRHVGCTDRVAEAAQMVEAQIILNVQGDEPLLRPEMLDLVLEPMLRAPQQLCANLKAEIISPAEPANPNLVKVVCDLAGNALYFSREAIPSPKKAGDEKWKVYHQLGVIAFRSDFLQTFAKLPSTPLERIESVDMMRALEHGYKVQMIASPFPCAGVDTPADLERTIEIMRTDPVHSLYHPHHP